MSSTTKGLQFWDAAGELVDWSAYAALAAERDTLRKAVEALLSLDVRGHQLRDRLQFSDQGRAILELCKP